MSTFFEAIYEEGVFRPLAYHHFKEHQRYRLMLVDEITTAELLPETSISEELAQRTIVLRDGRLVINLLGLFHDETLALSYEEIEALLEEFRREQAHEWDTLADGQE